MLQALIQPVECKIAVRGEEALSLYESVREVRVEAKRGEASVCTVVCDSVRLEDGDWSISDGILGLTPWADFKVDAKFGNHIEPVFDGLVRELRLEFPQEMSGAKVTVVAQDHTLRLDREHERRPLSTTDAPKNDGSIVRELAQSCQLEVNDTGATVLSSASTAIEDGLCNGDLNLDGTPISLIRQRAQANAYEFYTRGKRVYFHPPRFVGDPQPPILVYAGPATNCTGINIQHDGHRPDQIRSTLASEQSAEPQEHTASPNWPLLGSEAANGTHSGLNPYIWNLQSPMGRPEEVQVRTQATANEQSLRIVAEGELDGAVYGHVLRNYETVTLDGVGSRYSGRYYVADVVHVFSAEGYRQQFKLLRNATGNTETSGISDSLTSVRAR